MSMDTDVSNRELKYVKICSKWKLKNDSHFPHSSENV